MFRKSILSLVIILSIFSVFSNTVYSQFLGISGNEISLEMIPEIPAPGDSIFLRIDSSATKLDNHFISWFVNKEEISSGQGKKTFEFTLDRNRRETEVLIVVRLREGGVIEKKIKIEPTSMELLWEAETYTPPFFKGKPLFSRQAKVKVIAVPHILRGDKEVHPENLVYKWTRNGEVLGDVNGYGKDYIIINGTVIGRDMEMEVEATDSLTGKTAYGTTLIRVVDPFILFYKKDYLYGLESQKSLGNIEPLKGKEIDILAVPYFFSETNLNNLIYNWRINGKQLTDGRNDANKIFRKVEDVFGVSDISVDVSHYSKIMQGADKKIRIDFQKDSTSELNNDFGNLEY